MGRLSLDRPQRNNNYYRISQLRRLCHINKVFVNAKGAKRKDYVNALLKANTELNEKNKDITSKNIARGIDSHPTISCCDLLDLLSRKVALIDDKIGISEYKSLLYEYIYNLEDEFGTPIKISSDRSSDLDDESEYDNHLLSNSAILNHIRHCCGHGDFLDELLKDSSELFENQEYSYFLLILSLILPKDMCIEYLDKLWGCIPLLNRSAKHGIFEEDCWCDDPSEIVPKIFPSECPVNYKMLLDYIGCSDGHSLFKLLMGDTCRDLLISHEDLQLAIESGANVPDSFLEIHKAMSPVSSYRQILSDILDYNEVFLYFRIQTSNYLYNFSDCSVPDRPYNIIPVFSDGNCGCEEFDISFFSFMYSWIYPRGEKYKVRDFLAWVERTGYNCEEYHYEEEGGSIFIAVDDGFCSYREKCDDFEIKKLIYEYNREMDIKQPQIDDLLAYISETELSQFLESLGSVKAKISIDYGEITLEANSRQKSARK